jgi:hypothetical protein
MPERTRHLAFGDVAAARGMLDELGVIGVIDQAAGPRPAGQPLSTGTYLALAALNRLVAPCSKAAFAHWWKTTAADRFTKIPASALDHQRFWDAMHAVTVEQLEEASRTITVRMVQACGLEDDPFGKHVLITSHDDWPAAEVIAGYRSQSEAEFGFGQLKDPHVVSFSPMHHWTGHNIRVHVFTCVLALQIAHLMRYRARQAGLDLSVRQLLSQLAAIGETVLIYPSTGGRPKARRMTTELTGNQPQLHQIFNLARWAPQKLGHTPKQAPAHR